MEKRIKDQLRYLTSNAADTDWGTVVTTIGHQFIPPKGHYPLSVHPGAYHFKPQTGRILDEYQLVYITQGGGHFSSCQSGSEQQEVSAGTMIVLFPGQWHSYSPNPDSGWDEYWVGFRSSQFDKWVEKRFFTPEEPLLQIGLSATLVGLYEEILRFATEEKSGYQQMISSIVLHILGTVYYKKKNNLFPNAYMVDKINQARILMKDMESKPLSAEEIAATLGIGYSWFRQTFKEYTGISPVQYRQQQRLLRAKELLTGSSLSISEIAYSLQFENAGQFSTFFSRMEGINPSMFRKRGH